MIIQTKTFLKNKIILTNYDDWLNTRFSDNLRTEFATSVGEEISDDYGQWDINVSMIITESVSLVIEGISLTDEVIFTYDRNQYAPVGIYKNGRR